MKTVGLYEAKTNLSALVAEVETTGEAIALTKHGHVVAQLAPPPSVSKKKAGMLASNDFFIAADFDQDLGGFEELFAEEADEVPRRELKVAEDPARYRTSGDA